jgi:hypothetical protein
MIRSDTEGKKTTLRENINFLLNIIRQKRV